MILDSGYSEHIFFTARQLTNLVRYKVNEKFVVVANGEKVPVMDGENVEYSGEYSTYVPRHSHNLLSVNSLMKEGTRVLFQDNHANISKGESSLDFTTLRANKINNLYKILNQLKGYIVIIQPTILYLELRARGTFTQVRTVY